VGFAVFPVATSTSKTTGALCDANQSVLRVSQPEERISSQRSATIRPTKAEPHSSVVVVGFGVLGTTPIACEETDSRQSMRFENGGSSE
jgi:hypothetical protein